MTEHPHPHPHPHVFRMVVHGNVESIVEDNSGAAYDLATPYTISLEPCEVRRINYEVSTQIPPGYAGLIMLRSSAPSKWGIRQTNAVGLIDPSYCGPGDYLMQEIENVRPKAIQIPKGTRIGQLLLVPFTKFDIVRHQGTLENSRENRGGYGSTGN